MGAFGLAGLIVVAAIGTAWLMVPDAFPRLRAPARRGTPTHGRGRDCRTPALPAPADPASLRCPAGGAAASMSPGSAPAACWSPPAARRPGAEVQLLEGGRELGRARADARGEWVILPGDPLPPGPKELALLARSPGGDPIRSRETLLLVVPEPQVRPGARVAGGAPRRPAPLAMLLPPTAAAGAAPRPLQAPAEAAAGRPAPRPRRGGLRRGRRHALRRQRPAGCDRAGLCRPRACRRCGRRSRRPLGADARPPSRASAATPCGWTSWPPPAASRRGSSCPSSATGYRRMCWPMAGWWCSPAPTSGASPAGSMAAAPATR